MKVSEAMTRDVHLANPNETVQQAARLMASLDAGVLPVGENDRLVGMITDRDIAIKGIARGKGPEARVRDIMTSGNIVSTTRRSKRSRATWAISRCAGCLSSITTSVWLASFRWAILP